MAGGNQDFGSMSKKQKRAARKAAQTNTGGTQPEQDLGTI